MIIEILICATWIICGIIAITKKMSSSKENDIFNTILCGIVISTLLLFFSLPISACLAPMAAPFSCSDVLETHELQRLDRYYAMKQAIDDTIVLKYNDTIIKERNYVIVDMDTMNNINEPTVYKCKLKHSPLVSLIYQYLPLDYYVIVIHTEQIGVSKCIANK